MDLSVDHPRQAVHDLNVVFRDVGHGGKVGSVWHGSTSGRTCLQGVLHAIRRSHSILSYNDIRDTIWKIYRLVAVRCAKYWNTEEAATLQVQAGAH